MILSNARQSGESRPVSFPWHLSPFLVFYTPALSCTPFGITAARGSLRPFFKARGNEMSRTRPTLETPLFLSPPYRKSDDESYASFVSPPSFELSKPRGGKKFWEENEFFSRLLNRKNRSLASHICIIPFRRKRSNSRVSLRVRGEGCAFP